MTSLSSSLSLFLSLTSSAAISNDVSGRFARLMCLINHGLPLLPQQCVSRNTRNQSNPPIPERKCGNLAREMSKLDVDDILKYYTLDLSHAHIYIYIYLINFLKLTINQRASSVRIYLFSNFFNGSTIVFKIFLARYSRVNESRIYSSDSTWAELREWNMVSTINHALLRVC